MKYFAFSDVHGCINELKKALDNAGYDSNNKEHKLIFCGDAFGHNNTGHYEMYLFLKDSIANDKLIWIMGNHEYYLLNALEKSKPGTFTSDTIRDIAIGLNPNAINYSDLECLQVLKSNKIDEFIRNNCVNYFELNDYVFTHGFIPYNKAKMEYDPNWRNKQFNKWLSVITTNGQKLVNEGIRIPNKKLVCGHVGAYYGYIIKNYPGLSLDSKDFNKIKAKLMKNAKVNSKPFETYYGDGVIGLDSRSYDTHMVNILIVEE